MKESLITNVEDIIKYLEESEQTIEVRGALASAKTFKNSLGVLDEKYLKVIQKEEVKTADKEPEVEAPVVKEEVKEVKKETKK